MASYSLTYSYISTKKYRAILKISEMILSYLVVFPILESARNGYVVGACDKFFISCVEQEK